MDSMSTQEMIAVLLARNDISERELMLLDRLQTTLDEVSALEAELKAAQLTEHERS